MPRRAASGTPGLVKVHVRGCARPKRPEKCRCAWSGHYKGQHVVLHVWCGAEVDPQDKKAADTVFTRMKQAIGDREFDRAGERKTSSGGQSLSDFIGDWWLDHVEEHHLSTDSLKPMCDVIKASALGVRSMQDLAPDTERIEKWLHATRKDKKWKPGTFNEYRALLLRLFRRAVERKKVTFNPVHAIARMKGVDNQRGELRHARLRPEQIEKRLFAACEQLNRTQCPNTKSKLTQAKADAIRAAVEEGTLQKSLATKYRVSEAVVSSIVLGKIWNPARRVTTTKGNEMHRRLLGAFYLGARAGELSAVQIKHVDWNDPRPLTHTDGTTYNGYVITMPAQLTKGGKTTGKDEQLFAKEHRLCKMLEARREQFRNTTRRYEAFIFGTDSGHRVLSFKKSWRALFTAAGLTYGRSYGLVWHTIKHEFASRAVEKAPTLAVAQDLTRHKDIKTLQRYVHTKQEAAWDAAVGYDEP